MTEFIFRNPIALDHALSQWVKETQATVLTADDPWRKLVGFATHVPERNRTNPRDTSRRGSWHHVGFTVPGELCNEALPEPLNPGFILFTTDLPEAVWFWISIRDLARAYVSQGQRIEYRDWQLATIQDRNRAAFVHTYPHGLKGKDAEIIARRDLGML